MALFWLGNIVKTVIARYISSHFHKEAHFSKMKDALEQARPAPPPGPLSHSVHSVHHAAMCLFVVVAFMCSQRRYASQICDPSKLFSPMQPLIDALTNCGGGRQQNGLSVEGNQIQRQQ